MANINQTARVANPFGTPFGGGRGNNGLDYALKPGYILKARNNFYVVEAREALSVDLVFSDTFTVTSASGVLTTSAVARNDTLPLKQYGAASVAAVAVSKSVQFVPASKTISNGGINMYARLN